MGSHDPHPDADPDETRDESTEPEHTATTAQSDRPNEGLPLSRRATLASLVGVGGLGLASRAASAAKVKTWKKDRDADGNDLVNLGTLAMDDNPGGIRDFAGANLAIDGSNVLNADTWDTNVDGDGREIFDLGAVAMRTNRTKIVDFAGDNLSIDGANVLNAEGSPWAVADGDDLLELDAGFEGIDLTDTSNGRVLADLVVAGTRVETPTVQSAAGTPLTLHTDAGTRALRLGVPGTDRDDTTAGANVVGGHPSNSATGAVGATVGGGGSDGSRTVDGGSRANTNVVLDDYGTVAGGRTNRAGTDAFAARFPTVGGGSGNTASDRGATVAGGDRNTASGGGAFVGGGTLNTASESFTTVGGGLQNTASGIDATVGGGSENEARSNNSTIGGGSRNRTGESLREGVAATVPGGDNNRALGAHSFAAGHSAEARHRGTFVWSDQDLSTFSSTGADQFLVDAAGGMGVGTNAPGSRLHVADDLARDVVGPGGHVATIDNESSDGSADVLLLQTGAADPGHANNYVTFTGAGTAVGAIEGDGSGGLNYTSGSADYAEYLPRRDPDEAIDAADVVGVVGGAVTKRTAEADQALVVSDQSIVTGNSPGQDPEARADYEPCAFVGQVPVTVRGPVDVGDLVVPSGEHDGTGRAIAPGDYRPGDGPIVGRAWDGTDLGGVSEVTVSVGLETGEALQSALAHQAGRIDDLEAENERTDERLSELETEIERKDERLSELEAETERKDERLADLEAEVDRKTERLADLEDRLAALAAQVGSTETAPADD